MGQGRFTFLGPREQPIIDLGPRDSFRSSTSQDKIYAWIESGEIKLRLTVKDKYGRVLTFINGNDWTVLPALIDDRNYDATALEVVADGEIVLQVELIDDCVKICMIYTNYDGRKIALTDYGTVFYESGRNPQPFKPIFVYPSRGNFGRRAIP
jgi:hypothetical protein